MHTLRQRDMGKGPHCYRVCLHMCLFFSRTFPYSNTRVLDDTRISHLLPGRMMSDQKELAHCRVFFTPKLPLFVVVYTFTLKHLHFRITPHFLLMHRIFNNEQLCFRTAILKSQQLFGQENLDTPVPVCINT